MCIFMATPMTYGSSYTSDWIQVTAATYAPAVAMLDPNASAGPGIQPVSQHPRSASNPIVPHRQLLVLDFEWYLVWENEFL